MPAPSTDQERTSAYTTASVTYVYSDGSKKTSALSFKPLYSSLDVISGVTGGQVYDINGNVLLDDNGNPFIANTPDANSTKVEGAPATGKGGNPLSGDALRICLNRQFGSTKDMYGKAPMVMKLSTIDQNQSSGELSVTALKNINMAAHPRIMDSCQVAVAVEHPLGQRRI